MRPDWSPGNLFRTNQWIHLATVIARDRGPVLRQRGTRGFRPEPDTLQPPSARRTQSPGARQPEGQLRTTEPDIIDTEAFMDEFRVWRGARTGDQIRENLFRRLTGKEPDLVCLLNFDDQTPADKSARANATKLVGNARIVPAPLPSPGELIPMASFSGRVTDGAGNPAAGATVRVDRDREMVATTLTDATGAYEIGFKYAPGTYDLFAELGQLAVWRTNVPVTPQTPARFDLALGASSTISGALLALDGDAAGPRGGRGGGRRHWAGGRPMRRAMPGASSRSAIFGPAPTASAPAGPTDMFIMRIAGWWRLPRARPSRTLICAFHPRRKGRGRSSTPRAAWRMTTKSARS